MKKLKNCFLSTRPQFFPGIIMPVLLGASTAWGTSGHINFPLFLLSLLAALFYHAGMNVFNDYFDYLNGSDNINKKALTPFTGGSRFIQKGLMTPRETLTLGILLVSAGSLIGIYLAFKTSLLLLLIGGFGLLSGIFYTAPPVFLSGRGLGEVTVGLNFGLLTVLGSYIVQTGHAHAAAVFASLPLSFLIAALLYINEFPDYEADQRAGKRTLVVRLGPERGRSWFGFLLLGAYSSIALGAALGYLPLLSLLALFSAVFAIPSFAGLLKNWRGGPELLPSIKSVILAHLSSGLLLVSASIASRLT